MPIPLTRRIPKPEPGEYPPYAGMYIDLLPPDGRLLEHLQRGLDAVLASIPQLTEEQLLHRYAEGKWTTREVLVHIIDDERIYCYRALRFARGDTTELPGFEQDDFARHSAANDRPLASILAEYSAVRQATIALFEGLPDEAFARGGTANGNFATVRALAYHIAGHELHHLNLLRDRYFLPIHMEGQ